jgi:hypothetical protein
VANIIINKTKTRVNWMPPRKKEKTLNDATIEKKKTPLHTIGYSLFSIIGLVFLTLPMLAFIPQLELITNVASPKN